MTPPKIELLFFPGCPNVEQTREQLRKALHNLDLPTQWTEIDVSAEQTPPQYQGFGSPTILINGRDVMGAQPAAGASCRIYSQSESLGVPPLDAIVTALRSTTSPKRSGSWLGMLTAIPTVAISALPILPVAACTACWPAYAAALSALGVPFLFDSSWLKPVMIVAIIISIGALAFRAPQRRGYGPAFVGALAGLGIILSKFALNSTIGLYLGAFALIVASIWNLWPARSSIACIGCSK